MVFQKSWIVAVREKRKKVNANMKRVGTSGNEIGLALGREGWAPFPVPSHLIFCAFPLSWEPWISFNEILGGSDKAKGVTRRIKAETCAYVGIYLRTVSNSCVYL